MNTRSTLAHTIARAALLLVLGSVAVAAQTPAAGQSATKPDSLQKIPVRIEVLLTRFQGEKKVSSLPFGLLANANDWRASFEPVSIRMGVDVPIGTTTETENRTVPSPGPGGAARSTESTNTKTQYRNVGTDIDAWASRLDESRFSVRVSISDSSIYSPDGDGKSWKTLQPAAFRTFSTSNTVVMRDGQTVLFGTGTDKISGETLKIEVTLHVVK